MEGAHQSCWQAAGGWSAENDRITIRNARLLHLSCCCNLCLQHVGRFRDQEEAARAYDRAALHLLGPMVSCFGGEAAAWIPAGQANVGRQALVRGGGGYSASCRQPTTVPPDPAPSQHASCVRGRRSSRRSEEEAGGRFRQPRPSRGLGAALHAASTCQPPRLPPRPPGNLDAIDAWRV